jgi:RND family efflux transporter MFP subunit
MFLCRLILCVVLAAVGTISPYSRAQVATPAAVFESKPLREIAVYPDREAIATVVGRNESKLSAETSGVVTRWTLDVGAPVKRAEVLVTLDATDAQLSVARAQAALDGATARSHLSQAQLKRAKELKEQGFISPEALLQRETEAALALTDVAANKAQLATAQRALSKTVIRAPFAGTVKQRLAQLGESVAPGAVLYVLLDNNAAEITAAVQPRDIVSLRASKAVMFEAAGLSIPVSLSRVSNVVSLPARTQEVRLAIGNDGNDLPVGTEGRLRWKDAQAHVPAQFIVQRGKLLGVFIEQNSKAAFVPLPNAQEGRATPVQLPPETKIVTRGGAALQEGQSLLARN